MSFIDDIKSYVEGCLTLAHLPENVYTFADTYSGESEVENLLIPFLLIVSLQCSKTTLQSLSLLVQQTDAGNH